MDLSPYPKLLKDYINYQLAIKSRSQRTAEAYIHDLVKFFKFLMLEFGLAPKNTDLKDIDIRSLDIEFFKQISLEDAYSFIAAYKNDHHNSSKTLSRKISSIRGFFKYLHANRSLLSSNPMIGLELPKANKRLPKFLTLVQSLDLLACVDGPYYERDYCIIALFLNTGMRLSELCSLDCASIGPDSTIRIIGKGNKERLVYLNELCLKAIENYLAVRPRMGLKDENALFISRNNNRINPRSVELIIEKNLKKCGLSEMGFSVHTLRHTAATLLYQYADADVLVLKEILGHENLNTTQIYTHVFDEQIKTAVDANPLAKIEPKKRTK